MKKATVVYAALSVLFLSLAIVLTSFGQESHGAILLNMVNSLHSLEQMSLYYSA